MPKRKRRRLLPVKPRKGKLPNRKRRLLPNRKRRLGRKIYGVFKINRMAWPTKMTIMTIL